MLNGISLLEVHMRAEIIAHIWQLISALSQEKKSAYPQTILMFPN